METPRQCLTCSKAITGRADKKFCSDYCRATYRNAKQKQLPAYVHFVHQKLLHNREVLVELCPEGKAKVEKEKLVQRGFHAGYLTNVYQTKKGTCYSFCFDYGYCSLPHGKVLIVKLQPYVQEQFEQGLLDEKTLYLINRYFL